MSREVGTRVVVTRGEGKTSGKGVIVEAAVGGARGQKSYLVQFDSGAVCRVPQSDIRGIASRT